MQSAGKAPETLDPALPAQMHDKFATFVHEKEGVTLDFYEMIHKAYAGLKRRRYDQSPCKCRVCGTFLESTYLEERLYAVRCEKCCTITLVKARRPEDAERSVGTM